MGTCRRGGFWACDLGSGIREKPWCQVSWSHQRQLRLRTVASVSLFTVTPLRTAGKNPPQQRLLQRLARYKNTCSRSRKAGVYPWEAWYLLPGDLSSGNFSMTNAAARGSPWLPDGDGWRKHLSDEGKLCRLNYSWTLSMNGLSTHLEAALLSVYLPACCLLFVLSLLLAKYF